LLRGVVGKQRIDKRSGECTGDLLPNLLVGVVARLDGLGPGRDRVLIRNRAVDSAPGYFLQLAQGGLGMQRTVVELLQAFLGLAAKRVARKARLGENRGGQKHER